MKKRTGVLFSLSLLLLLGGIAVAQNAPKPIPLSTSKQLMEPVPGSPQPMGAFPVNIAVSPDQKYAAILEAGYGTPETELHQSIAVLSFASGKIMRFADPRLGLRAHQSFFLGIAWGSDGKHIYAPMVSISDPTGSKRKEDTGNGIAVYVFDGENIAPERFIPVPPQTLAPGKKRGTVHKEAPAGLLAPYPAGIAVVNREGGDQLLVADNLSDDVLLIDAKTGSVVHRFDLSEGSYVPSVYPYSVVVNKDRRTAYVSLWNAPKVAVLDLEKGTVQQSIAIAGQEAAGASSHPTAMVLSPDGRVLFVTVSAADRVAVIDTGSGRVAGYLSTELPGQLYGGSYPNSVAISPDGSTLYVANASSDAVAIYNLKRSLRYGKKVSISSNGKAIAFIPTEWYPTAVAVHGDELLIATGKGTGTGPNNIAKKPGELGFLKGYTYVATLLKGSLARVDLREIEPNLKQLTDEVLESNLMNGRIGTLPFKGGKNPIKHVIYIIKENRTYDQLFGDLEVGNGDKSLTMYGEDITPNQHKLARQFGVLDNFYDSGEVSGNGHVWSNAAITSDYTEKTWQIDYRGSEHTYDYEGTVGQDIPLQLGIPDVNEPGTGYLWTNLARHKKTYRHYGEYITSRWCDRHAEWQSPLEGTPPAEPAQCEKSVIKPGESLPSNVGDPKGGPSPYPWDIPILAQNVPTKPELVGHDDPRFPDFRLEYPDQLRADEFLNEFNQWVETLAQTKHDGMPQFITLRLPNDHTSGTRPGVATPEAAVADNDLAVGRVVDAVSHSPYWNNTAIFILEDDAQDGVDHVDAHRSIALLVSKYAPGSTQEPYVDSHFYTTVNLIHTMEVLLGLPPMNNNDAQAAIMAPLFSGAGDQPAFKADYRNRDNKLIYQANEKKAVGAKQSAAMDFSHADQADTAVLNAILWRERMGNKPMPKPKHSVFPVTSGKRVGDDD